MAPGWNTALLSSGVYKYTPYLGTMDLREVLEAGDVLYYREGAAGVVSVRRSGAVLSLSIDGKVDASNGGDMLTQKLLAHLPLLLSLVTQAGGSRRSRQRRDRGSGAGPSSRPPRRHRDFTGSGRGVAPVDPYSGRPLSDPRTRLIVGDTHTLHAQAQPFEPL